MNMAALSSAQNRKPTKIWPVESPRTGFVVFVLKEKDSRRRLKQRNAFSCQKLRDVRTHLDPPHTMVVVDDLSIIAPSGEAFDLNDDFALPKGSKFYSDLNAPEGAPSRAERIAKQQREQPRQQAQAQAQRSAAAPAESAEEVALDVRTSCERMRLPAIAVRGRAEPDLQVSPCHVQDPQAGGPPLLNNTGYYQPAPTYSARYQVCPCVPSCGSPPHHLGFRYDWPTRSLMCACAGRTTPHLL